MDLAEGGGTGLLIDRHGFTAEQGIDKSGLSGIEVASDKDLGRGVLNTEAEFVDMGNGSSDTVAEEAFDGRLFKLMDERGGSGGGGGGVRAQVEVKFEDVESSAGNDRQGVVVVAVVVVVGILWVVGMV